MDDNRYPPDGIDLVNREPGTDVYSMIKSCLLIVGILWAAVSLRAQPKQYLLVVGQSNGAAVGGSPALTTTQAYSNQTFVYGCYYSSNRSQIWPLVETMGNSSEGVCNGITDSISSWDVTKSFIISSFAVSARPCSAISKGAPGTVYSDSIASVTDAKRLGGSPFLGVPAIFAVNGEQDTSNSGFRACMEQLRSDYETDIKAITRQSGTIPMFHSQVSWQYLTSQTVSALQALDMQEVEPDKMILATPTYFIPHGSDGTHYINTGHRQLGDYYAKAYYHKVVLGEPWGPLRPIQVASVDSTHVRLQLAGYVGNLVIDTTNVTDPGAVSGKYGFEFVDDAGAKAISSVVLTDASRGIITITIGAAMGRNPRLRYAFTPPSSCSTYCGGPTTGARGNIRDSDTTVGLGGVSLPNWLVMFDKPVSPLTPSARRGSGRGGAIH